MSGPWTFDEARATLVRCSQQQEHAERFVKDSYRDYAQAEEAYRLALAKRITELRAEGESVTLAADLARGDKHVAGLRMKRDIAEGVVEAAKQQAYRRTADRKDAQALATWSMRREMSELGVGVGG